jgi:D-alanine-D-alanine ligase
MSEFKKTRVGVIFGGRSGEHEVSLRSAESVIRSLDPSKYEVVPIAITHEGRWLGTRDAMKLLSPGEAIQAALKTGEPMAVVPEPQRNGAVDVFFPIVHGT